MALHKDLAAARAKIAELNANVVIEHEEGFFKALRQASVLLNVAKPLEIGFDIEKDVYDGVLTYVSPLTDLEDAAAGDTVVGTNEPNVDAEVGPDGGGEE